MHRHVRASSITSFCPGRESGRVAWLSALAAWASPQHPSQIVLFPETPLVSRVERPKCAQRRCHVIAQKWKNTLHLNVAQLPVWAGEVCFTTSAWQLKPVVRASMASNTRSLSTCTTYWLNIQIQRAAARSCRCNIPHIHRQVPAKISPLLRPCLAFSPKMQGYFIAWYVCTASATNGPQLQRFTGFRSPSHRLDAHLRHYNT